MTSHTDSAARIRALNDKLRTNIFTNPRLVEGPFHLMLTQGCRALAFADFQTLTRAVAAFDAFDDGNNPYNENDFGSVEMAGERFFFKIDYYAPGLTAGAENPEDSATTVRVLTLMRADEY